MNDEMSVLRGLDAYMKYSNKTYIPELLQQTCGIYFFECIRSFNSILDNLPNCLDKIIESEAFTKDSLVIKGDYDKVDKKLSRYIAQLTSSYANLMWLFGKERTYVRNSTTITTQDSAIIKAKADYLMNNYLQFLESI